MHGGPPSRGSARRRGRTCAFPLARTLASRASAPPTTPERVPAHGGLRLDPEGSWSPPIARDHELQQTAIADGAEQCPPTDLHLLVGREQLLHRLQHVTHIF